MQKATLSGKDWHLLTTSGSMEENTNMQEGQQSRIEGGLDVTCPSSGLKRNEHQK